MCYCTLLSLNCASSCGRSAAYCIKAELVLTLCLATLQVSQVKAEADKQVARLTSSLKQAQSQAARISWERERLAAQVQQQAATPQAAPEVGPYPSSKQQAVTLHLQPSRENQAVPKPAPAQEQTWAYGHTSLFKQLVVLP